MKTVLNPVEELLKKLEGKLPEDLWEEVNELLSEQEEEIKSLGNRVEELKDEVDDLEDQVSDLERDTLDFDEVYDFLNGYKMKSGDWKDVEKLLEANGSGDYAYLRFPSWMLPANPFLGDQLEELICKLGVEESVQLLSNPVRS